MSEPVKTIDNELHKYFGIEFNNRIWKHFEKKDRTLAETLEMIHLAHASLLHWQSYEQSTKANVQRGYYMIAKSYLHAGDAYHAMHFAELCLATTNEFKAQMKDFDIAYAYEIMAKTCTLVGDVDNAENYAEMAEEAGKQIVDINDKKYFETDYEKDWDLFEDVVI